jgi:hypothetical protein
MTDAILPFKGDKLKYNLVKQGLIQYDEITTTESEVVECDNSIVQEVLMWKNFHKWARTVEQDSKEAPGCSTTCGSWWSGDSSSIKEANSIASYSLLTQEILDGLMKSVSTGGSKVTIGQF